MTLLFPLAVLPRRTLARLAARDELERRLVAVTGDRDAARRGPLADEARRRQTVHDTSAVYLPHPSDPNHGLASVYQDIIAGRLSPDGEVPS